jgi:hypothetical protein
MTSAAPTPPNTTKQQSPRSASSVALMTGCLHALILLNLIMIAAGLAGIDPSPEPDVLPFIAATAALGIAATPLVVAHERLGYQIGILFSLVSMIGIGPHKLFLEDGGIIAPVALVGFTAEIVFIWAATRELRTQPNTSHS